ncbi:MAG: DUF4430 domain-containing protein [Candidatus Hermodarchaeota archaeon]
MKNLKKIIYFIATLVLIQLIFSSSVPIVKADNTIADSYYQNLDFNRTYVYEVSKFGDSVGWYNFTPWPGNSYEGDWKSNPGGQIWINLTGFYKKDSNDWGNVFEDPIPWYDLNIIENNLGLLNINFTLNNRSNSEVARALTLGFNNFQSGFLIPNANLTQIKELATQQADPGGLYDIVGKIELEETYNFLYIGFSQIGGNQQTDLIYDKKSGLLVWAKTSIFGYLLEIQSLNFTLDYASSFIYNVDNFGGAVGWYNFTPWPGNSYEGDWKTNSGGQIIVNFTGYYDKDPNDWGNILYGPIPWFDIEVVENISSIFLTNFTLSNRSNSELSWALTLGYNNFQPGFLLHIVNNLTSVKKLALQEASGFVNGLVTIEETELAIKITFDQIGGGQGTYLIYEKRTGLLLWVKTFVGSYLLEMAINEYTPWEFDGENNIIPNDLLQKALPYIIISSISIILMSTSMIISRVNRKFKKFNKFVLIAILASASFTSFFVFTSSIKIGEVNEPLRNVQDISLVVDYGNGTIKMWENFELSNYNTTAFDALKKWCKIEYTDYGDMGILVESINHLKGNWRFSINDEFPGVSANKYNLQNGDLVKWIFG